MATAKAQPTAKNEVTSQTDQTTPETKANTKADTKADAERKAQELVSARAVITTEKAEKLLIELFKDPATKEAKKAMSDASQDVIMMALTICTNCLEVVRDSDTAKQFPPSTVEAAQELIGETKEPAILKAARILTRNAVSMAAENLDTYSNLGPAYAGVPLGVDMGLELGVQTGEGETLQRTGIIFGLRCDHLSGHKPARRMVNRL